MTDRNAETIPAPRTITFAVKRVTLLRLDGPDFVHIKVDAPTTHPSMGYETIIRVECTKGYGEQWCREVGLTIDEVIET